MRDSLSGCSIKGFCNTQKTAESMPNTFSTILLALDKQ